MCALPSGSNGVPSCVSVTGGGVDGGGGSTSACKNDSDCPSPTGSRCLTGKCVDGGCTPDQQPVFTCSADGTQGECQQGSICLRHSCYIGCNPDAGTDACKAADAFNVCKTVTTASGAHSVCGSNNNLGTECDPTQGKSCPSPLVCIDGFCK